MSGMGAATPRVGLNRQKFLSSGSFTVPAGVTSLYVTVIAGGGGGCIACSSNGGTGGTSSFGSFISCTGGTGGQAFNGSTQASGAPTFSGVTNTQSGHGLIDNIALGSATSAGARRAGTGGTRAGVGGAGAGVVAVTPGQVVTVTVGAVGADQDGSAAAGCVVVEWGQGV